MYPQVTQLETRQQLVREWLELREQRRTAKTSRQQRHALKLAELLHAPTRPGQSPAVMIESCSWWARRRW